MEVLRSTRIRKRAYLVLLMLLLLAGAAALRVPVTESLQRNRAMILLARYAVGQAHPNAAADLRQAQQAIGDVVKQDPERYRPIAEHLDARALAAWLWADTGRSHRYDFEAAVCQRAGSCRRRND